MDETLGESFHEDHKMLSRRLSEFCEQAKEIACSHIDVLKKTLAEFSGDLETTIDPNMFEVLGLRRDERSATHLLHWLLCSDSDHRGDQAFSRRVLPVLTGIEWDYGNLEVRKFVRIRAKVDAEIDILLRSMDRCVGVEMKTTHQESEEKLKRERDALRDEFGEHSDLVYLTPFNDEHDDYRTVRWSRVLRAIQEARDSLSLGPIPKMIIDQFLANMEVNVVSGFRELSQKTKLYLKYKDEIDKVVKQFERDRKKLLSDVLNRFESIQAGKEYKKWPKGEPSPSTKYVKVYKPKWHEGYPKVEFEVNEAFDAKDNQDRIAPGISVNLDIEGTDKSDARRALLRKAKDKIRELENRGFEVVSDTYHMIQKRIVLDESDDVVGEVMVALEDLMILEKDIDKVLGR